MKFWTLKPIKTVTTICSLLISGAIITACGGGVASVVLSGIGGTGIVFGSITGFGSIYVNGQKFETDDSQFIVDGTPGLTQDDLAVGMVVKLEVETEDGVFTGKAIEVIYDDEVEGPVAATPQEVNGPGSGQKTFDVFGQTINIDETDTIFEGTSFVDLDASQVVEISGLRVSSSEINATYVKYIDILNLGKTEVELRGLIKNLSTGTFPSFDIDNVEITTDGDTDIDVPNGILEIDQYVEVEGIILALLPKISVLAKEIEYEDESFGDDVDEISLQGIIFDWVDIDNNFTINGQPIDASNASLSPSNATEILDDGVEVEVEGDIVNGVLIADELEVKDGDSKLKSYVSFVYPDDIRFEVIYPPLAGSIVVHTDSQTLFKDEGPMQLPNFSVADLIIGDYVIVEGIETTDEIIAETVKRKDSLDPDDSKLEGEVDGFDPGMTNEGVSITVLGITYRVNSNTDYEDESGTLTASEFFTRLKIGDQVEIKDEKPVDGFADEVEFE